jgi:hypothetical protein
MLGVKHINTMAYNHKALPIERMHRTIGDTLRTLIKSSEISKWDKNLPLVEMILRSLATADRPFSPSEIQYGTKMRTPTEAEMEAYAKKPNVEMTEYVDDLKRRLSRLMQAQQKIIEVNKRNSSTKYNKKVRPTTYKDGDLVYLRNDGSKVGECSKFRREYLGPYAVVKVLSEHSLKLQNANNKKILKNPIHVDRVKHAHAKPVTAAKNKESTEVEEVKDYGQTPAEVEEVKAESSEHVEPEEQTVAEKEENGQNKSFRVENDVYEVKKLVGVKGSGAGKQYKVRWKKKPGDKFADQCVKKDDITENLIEEFHRTHTLDGKVRSQFRKKPKQ